MQITAGMVENTTVQLILNMNMNIFRTDHENCRSNGSAMQIYSFELGGEQEKGKAHIAPNFFMTYCFGIHSLMYQGYCPPDLRYHMNEDEMFSYQ